MLVQQSGEQCLPDGDGRLAMRCLPYVYRVMCFILKIFLICRDEKWKSGVVKAPGRGRRLFWRVTFRFGRRINSHINVATTAEGVGFAGQPFAYSVTVC